MKKPRPPQTPRWIVNLRALMDARKFNPRSLSLKAGLNATAVRDMLEGRTRFPRYDTVLALSSVLEVTPSQLMGGVMGEANASAAERPVKEAVEAKTQEDTRVSGLKTFPAPENDNSDDDLELLTEIITRLQEAAEDYRHQLNPRDFAAMAMTIYRRVRQPTPQKSRFDSALHPKIHDLMAYEMLRRRSKG